MATMLDATIRLKDEFSSVIKKIDQNAKDFQKTYKKMGKEVWDTGKNVKKSGSILTKSVTLPILGIGAAAIKTAIDAEDAFAGIRKTVDATEEEFRDMRKELDNMSLEIPIDKNELYAIGEAAGQLGVKKEHIVDFTDTIAKLGVTTNLTSEQAAGDLAKFANIMNMDLSNMDKLGSTIVDLGNNLATTEADIVGMSMRLAGAGKQIGLSEAEVLSFAGALSSVGIEAEAGGSAFSKVMINMQLAVETGMQGYDTLEKTVKNAGYSMSDVNSAMRNGGKELKQMAGALGMDSKAFRSVVDEAYKAQGSLEDFATVAGMSGEEFTKAFEKDAAGAITEFVKGIGDVERNGKSAIQVLDDMDIKEVRLRDTLLRAAGASDLFSEALAIGSKAWEENVAMAREADVRFGTTASKIQLVKNQVKLLGDQFGQILLPSVIKIMDKLKLFADELINMDDSTKKSIIQFAKFAAAIGPVLLVIGTLTMGVGKFLFIMSDVALAIKKAGGVMALLTGPGAIVLGIMAALVAAGILVYKNWDYIKEKALEIFPHLQENIGAVMENIKAIFSSSVELIKTVWSDLQPVITFVWEAIKSTFIVGVELIGTLIGNAVKTFSGLIDFITGVFTGNWEMAWNGVVKIFDGIFGAVEGVGKATINGLIGVINSGLKGLNKIKVPDWIPKALGGGKGINIPLIPQLAKGTDSWGGGIVQVHERGGEIIDLPNRARVYPHDKSVSMAREQGRKESGGGGVIVTGNTFNVRKESDIDSIATALYRKLNQAKINMA